MTARGVILVCDTSSWPVLHNYHQNIPNGFQVMQRTWNCIWNHLGEITQKVWKQELSFLYATHRHDLFYNTVKYHDYIPNSFEVMERTRNCIWNHQREITQEVWKQELSFLYATHPHDLFYITVKYHDYIPKSIQVTGQTWICIKKHQRGDYSKSIKARALIFVRDTLSWHVLHSYEVSSKYSKRYPSYWADTKMFTDGRTGRRRTDARLIAISPEPFGRGIKIDKYVLILSDVLENPSSAI